MTKINYKLILLGLLLMTILVGITTISAANTTATPQPTIDNQVTTSTPEIDTQVISDTSNNTISDNQKIRSTDKIQSDDNKNVKIEDNLKSDDNNIKNTVVSTNSKNNIKEATLNSTSTSINNDNAITYNNVTSQSKTSSKVKTSNLISTNTVINPINAHVSTKIQLNATVEDKYGFNMNSGTVRFRINGATIGVTNVTNGIASLYYYTPRTAGNYTIQAVYSGNGNYLASQKSTILYNNAVTYTTVSMPYITSNPSTKIQLNATVKDKNGNYINTGTVRFRINGATIGVTNVTNGIASLYYYTPRTVNYYTLQAVYSGSNNYASSTTTSTLNVKSTTSTITYITPITASPSTKIQLNATVTDKNGNKVNEGTVRFKINGATINIASVNNGVASLYYYTPRTVGNYSIQAIYSGTYNYATSQKTTTLTNNIPGVKTYIQLDDITALKSSKIDLTAHLVDENSNEVLDGSVTFKINGATIKTVPVDFGIANITYNTPMTPGIYTIQAIYNPTSGYKSSTTTVKLTVLNNKIKTLISTDSSYNAKEGQEIAIPVYVTDNNYNNIESGTVNYYINNDLIGSEDLSNGEAILYYYAPTTAGTYTLKVKYIDDTGLYSSNEMGSTLTVTPNQKSTTTTIQSVNTYPWTTVTLTATVEYSSSNYLNTGTVSFYINGAYIGTSSVYHDVATISYVSPKSAGTYTLKAVYNGNTNYATSSDTSTLTVTDTTIYVSVYGSDSSGTGTINNPYHTLYTAIQKTPNGGTVKLLSGTYTSLGNENVIDIYKNIAIVGDSDTIISINDEYRGIFFIPENYKVSMKDITFKNNYVDTLILNAGTSTITNCNFDNNEGSLTGAINNFGTMTISNSELNSNYGGQGGAINNEGTLTLNTCTLDYNSALNGGAINNTGTLTISNSEINHNSVSNGRGGAIASSGNMRIIYSTISYNTAEGSSDESVGDDLGTGNGGAIYLTNGITTINNTSLTNNVADYYGGAIFAYDIDNDESNTFKINIIDSELTSNSADYGGAISNGLGIYVGGTMTITGSEINNNKATDYGGAITNAADLAISNSNINSNTASYGGAIDNDWTLRLTNSDLNYNTATDKGGAIFTTQHTEIKGCTFDSDKAAYGGALCNVGGQGDGYLHVTQSSFTRNSNYAFYNYNLEYSDIYCEYNYWGASYPIWSNVLYNVNTPTHWNKS